MELMNEYTEAVNKPLWKKCCFSPDSDFIIAGAQVKNRHSIYVWNREFVQMVKILEGPKEGISDLVVRSTGCGLR